MFIQRPERAIASVGQNGNDAIGQPHGLSFPLACSDATKDSTFVTLDARLAEAASKEGFRVVPAS